MREIIDLKFYPLWREASMPDLSFKLVDENNVPEYPKSQTIDYYSVWIPVDFEACRRLNVRKEKKE